VKNLDEILLETPGNSPATSRRLDCYSCYHSGTDICFVAREGFPRAGPACAAFLYEPGTDTEERP